MIDRNEEILVSSLFLFYDEDNKELVATPDQNYPGVPFICTPTPKTARERYIFRMYKTNNLYYIISNGGVELNEKQKKIISNIRSKVVGYDDKSRIGNAYMATLTKEEVDFLVAKLNIWRTRSQTREMISKQDKGNDCQLQ